MTTGEREALLPCPFCGARASLSLGVGAEKYRTVGCTNEDCESPRWWWLRDDKTEQDAIAAWNTRALTHRQSESEEVRRLQLSMILNPGGVKHPQQSEWQWMLDRVRDLNAGHAKGGERPNLRADIAMVLVRDNPYASKEHYDKLVDEIMALLPTPPVEADDE